MSTHFVDVHTFPKPFLSNLEGSLRRKKDIFPDFEKKCFKVIKEGFNADWTRIQNELNCTFKGVKKSTAFECVLVTTQEDFLKNHFKWEIGREMSAELHQFWQDSYDWAVRKIGYLGTDRNILSAVVYEEDTLQLRVYYLPVTEKWRNKIYARDEKSGLIMLNAHGSPIQQRDEHGKIIYDYVESTVNPKLSKTEFWRVRGGRYAYSQLQDSFFDEVGIRYGLERGIPVKGSKYFSKAKTEALQLKAERDQLAAEIEPLRQLRAALNEIDESAATTKLPFGFVAVKETSFDTVKEQAKSYAVNRNEIATLRERSFVVSQREQLADLREQQLDDRARILAKQEQELQELYQQQLELNQLFEQAERGSVAKEQEIEILKKQLLQLKSSLERQSGSFNEQLEKNYAAAKELAERLQGAYQSIANIVKAVGMLKYDKMSGYKLDTLNDKQSRLIDAVTEYAAMWAREDGFPEMAEDIERYIGISKGIKDIIDAKDTHHTTNADWEL